MNSSSQSDCDPPLNWTLNILANGRQKVLQLSQETSPESNNYQENLVSKPPQKC